MKKLFTTQVQSSHTDMALLITRIAVASLMLTHGLPKLAMLAEGNIQFLPVMGMSAGLSLTLVVFAEVFCSLFILIGLGTRLASLPLLLTMLVAIFLVHGADPLAKKELAILYTIPYFILLVAGSGRYSLDHLLAGSRTKKAAEIDDPTLSIYNIQ